MYLPVQCFSDLFSTHPKPCILTEQFIESFSAAIVNRSENNFCNVLNYFCQMLFVNNQKVAIASPHPYQQTQRMFQLWQENSEGSFQCLREHMDNYSVFSGRNILVSINIVYFIVLSDVLFSTLNIYFSVIII